METRQIRTREVKKPETVEDKDQAFKDAAGNAEDRLVAFVNAQIDKMKQYTKLGHGGNPTFYEVNEALMSYNDTLTALLAMHNTAKIEYLKSKEIFEDWYAGKYIVVRDEVNPRSLSSQKWHSQKEIEMLIRQQYRDEYKRLSWDVSLTEQQLSFLRRLLDGWSSQQYLLTQLSKNLIAEVNGMGVESALSRGMETN